MASPRWLLLAFRLALLVCGPILLVLLLSSRVAPPAPAIVLMVVVGGGTLGLAVWRRPWGRFEQFIADEAGIAFPANDLLVMKPGATEDTRWLLVPWANIEHVRTARVRGDRTSCVAFDLRVTADERRDFFARVDMPTDRPDRSPTHVFAAYDNVPPAPAGTVARLLELRGRGGAVAGR